MEPEAVMTAAAQTANARLTEIVATTPEPATPSPTAEAVATTAAVETEATASVTPSPTGAPATGEATPAGPAQTTGTPGQAPAGDRAEFVADITVADGTEFQPNESFVKTWRLRNAGTSTWTTSYALNFLSGAPMGAPQTVPLPSEVPPNATVDVSVNLTAPSDPGTYTGYWNLVNAAGQTFGVGVEANEPFWVEIQVAGEGGGSGGNGGDSGTSGDYFGRVSLSADQATVSGECPHTFDFAAGFTLNRPARVTYQLEAGAADAGFEFDLPGPTTTNLDAGTYQFSYSLTFSASVSGWARLHITEPQDITSNQVNFSLTCE